MPQSAFLKLQINGNPLCSRKDDSSVEEKTFLSRYHATGENIELKDLGMQTIERLVRTRIPESWSLIRRLQSAYVAGVAADPVKLQS